MELIQGQMPDPGLGRRGRLVVVSCGAAKLDRPALAGQLYTGSYTRQALACARALAARSPDVSVRILSARYGLLRPSQGPVAPYERTLPSGIVDWREFWAGVPGRSELEMAAEVLVLGGVRYLAAVQAVRPDAWRPAGVESARGIGEQLAAMKRLRTSSRPWAEARGLRAV